MEQTQDISLNDISIVDFPVAALQEISLPDVYAFLTYMMSEHGNNANTRARKVSCIRSFFKYLTTKTDFLEKNPVKDLELPSGKKTLPKHLTLQESVELIEHISTSSPERDFCIITLFLNCGMRLSELVGMNLSDLRGNTLKLLGKGNKERIVYLNDACMHAIEQYLNVRSAIVSPKDPNAFFLSAQHRRISARRVQQIVGDCLRSAGLSGKGYSTHKLRHTAATLMYQHGHVDVRVLKEVLGHENLSTTEIYTHVSNQQIEEASKHSPLASLNIDK